jgi:hypothetical protein
MHVLCHVPQCKFKIIVTILHFMFMYKSICNSIYRFSKISNSSVCEIYYSKVFKFGNVLTSNFDVLGNIGNDNSLNNLSCEVNSLRIIEINSAGNRHFKLLKLIDFVPILSVFENDWMLEYIFVKAKQNFHRFTCYTMYIIWNHNSHVLKFL